MGTAQLLAEVKGAGEDFEWYPTTRRMLEVVARDIRTELAGLSFSILDIGAGNGSALATLRELTGNTGSQYAIEKSGVLLNALPSDVFVIGTDFYQQTLIDKRVDVVFCNPPYSDYATWMHRIVAEANCQLIYLVVPQRWKDDPRIADMIERRCRSTRNDDSDAGGCWILDSTSFRDSEHRQARATVDILKVKFASHRFKTGQPAVDPFDVWFDSTFAINADRVEEPDYKTEESNAQRLHNLVRGQNIVERLEELYRADFDKLLGTYRELEKLDRELFKELGVDLPKVKEGLKAKIKGLKNLYWQELFSNLDTITSRLTSKSRTALLEKLTSHTSIDFTANNAYAVVLWAIKNANTYFDRQLLDTYLALTNQENIRNYKSNHRVLTDKWRYTQGDHSHYSLDYRLVINRWHCFSASDYGYYEYPNGLHRDVHGLLNDLCTIGQNLGFSVTTNSLSLHWFPGALREFHLADGVLFMDVRAYKKGTIHVRMNQEFMRRLNVEAGRLNGWIKSPAEAREEMGVEAADVFGSNFKLTSVPLLPAPSQVAA